MRRTTLTALTVFACLSLPATASAAGRAENVRADRTALGAYATYLQGLLSSKPEAKAAELAFTTTTADTCKAALEPIASLSSVPKGWSTALTNVGEEIGDDANLELIDATAALPAAKLETTLATLRWTTAGQNNTIKRFLTAEDALLALDTSNLCGDALDAASETSSQDMATPAGTTDFLDQYDTAANAVKKTQTALLKQLDLYETSADDAVATKINTLAKKINTVTTNTIASTTTALETALGVTSPSTSAARTLGR